MKNKNNLTEVEYSPFDTPIPGQSLTDEPGNYPWEHPPQYTDVDEILDKMYDTLTKPTIARQLISMLDAGVPVEAIVRVMVFTGFAEGEFNPDVGFIIIEPLMEAVATIGLRAGVKNLKLSISDTGNKDFRKTMSELKLANEQKEMPMPAKEIENKKPQGLLAKPEETK